MSRREIWAVPSLGIPGRQMCFKKEGYSVKISAAGRTNKMRKNTDKNTDPSIWYRGPLSRAEVVELLGWNSLERERR